jgi:aminoglycoside phosphotransferase (APT) family kinase protein
VTVDADLPGQLLRVLRTVTGMPALAYARAPEALSGGFWAELLAFSLTDPPEGWPRELVARVMPDPGLARKETIVQSAVAAAGYPTPAVRASGGPDSGLGRAFMVMDRAPGVPLMSGLSGAGAIAGALRVVGQLPEVLASSMAALHALDPQCIHEQLGQADDVPTTLAGLLDALRATAASYGRPDLVDAASRAWLVGL